MKVAYDKTKNNLSAVEARFVASFNTINDLINELGTVPTKQGIKNRYFDFLTFQKRIELFRFIKKNLDSDVVSSVNNYYSEKYVKQKIKEMKKN